MRPASLDGWKWRRIASALCAALLAVSCGGGSGGRDAGASAQAADPEAAEVARQLSAGDDQAAQAVDAAQSGEGSEAAQGLFGFGSRIRQVVVFGDSLSDVGTYQVDDIAAVGGGKFTTNPGRVWPEFIGILFGARVTPFRQGFAGKSQVLGGTGFAMGGARVSAPCTPDPTAGICLELAIPVTQQVSDYLDANGNRFDRRQLVFVFAGANDIFAQLEFFAFQVGVGVGVEQAAKDALGGVALAAQQLAAQVGRIQERGATRIAVLTVPDIADSIFGKAQPPLVQKLIVDMVNTFNSTLVGSLDARKVKTIDIHALFKDLVENPGRYGVSELNVPACDAARIEAITNGNVKDGSSLFCSPLTLVQFFAPFTYLFADTVHPTTLGHLNIARFVLTEMWRQGLF